MVFDRSAIKTGRRIQDFGLCDLKGTYQNSAKLRSKGYLLIAFFAADDFNSAAVAKNLQDWLSVSDKIAAAALIVGERDAATDFVTDTGITYTVLWDAEDYIAAQWSISAVPAVFVVDSQGMVINTILGNNLAELNSAKDQLAETILKAEEIAKLAADAAAQAAAAAPTKK